ncbi:MAG: hypothetical protein WB762_25235 [Candidatus Sulfotelmatobacter sp.]
MVKRSAKNTVFTPTVGQRMTRPRLEVKVKIIGHHKVPQTGGQVLIEPANQNEAQGARLSQQISHDAKPFPIEPLSASAGHPVFFW